MKFMIPLLLLLAACCSTNGGESTKMKVVIRNNTRYDLTFSASLGPFSQSMTIPSHYTWRGSVLKQFMGDSLTIDVESKD